MVRKIAAWPTAITSVIERMLIVTNAPTVPMTDIGRRSMLKRPVTAATAITQMKTKSVGAGWNWTTPKIANPRATAAS